RETRPRRLLEHRRSLPMMRRQQALPLAVLAVLLAGDGYPLRAEPPPAPSGGGLRPVIAVQASYPGANAQVVADAVAAPIEQQVQGVADVVSLVSQCSHDGSYTLLVTFAPGVDAR